MTNTVKLVSKMVFHLLMKTLKHITKTLSAVIALKEITATKRIFGAFSQSEILKEIWLHEQKDIQFEAWLKILIQNKEARQSITAAFERTAIGNVLPAFEVFANEGL